MSHAHVTDNRAQQTPTSSHERILRRHKHDKHRRLGLAARLRADIDRALHARYAPPDTRMARLESTLKSGGERVWAEVQKRPLLGVAGVGGIALLAALEVGVAELAFAVGAGYAAYEVLRRGVPVDQAIDDARKLV